MMWGEETSGRFSLVEHPIPPGHLAAQCIGIPVKMNTDTCSTVASAPC